MLVIIITKYTCYRTQSRAGESVLVGGVGVEWGRGGGGGYEYQIKIRNTFRLEARRVGVRCSAEVHFMLV